MGFILTTAPTCRLGQRVEQVLPQSAPASPLLPAALGGTSLLRTATEINLLVLTSPPDDAR